MLTARGLWPEVHFWREPESDPHPDGLLASARIRALSCTRCPFEAALATGKRRGSRAFNAARAAMLNHWNEAHR